MNAIPANTLPSNATASNQPATNPAIPLAEQSTASPLATQPQPTESINTASGGDRLHISAGARALANNLNAENIARATETNESAVREAGESTQRQIRESEQFQLTAIQIAAEQPKVNPATQKTITTRIDVVA